MPCDQCTAFFAQYKCNTPLECDCPKCQGQCNCNYLAEYKNNEIEIDNLQHRRNSGGSYTGADTDRTCALLLRQIELAEILF